MPEPVINVAAGGSSTGSAPRRGRPTATRGKAANSVKKAKPAVSDKELVDALSTGLSVGLMAYFQFVARVPKNEREELDPTTEEADAFCTPIAKLINRQSFGGAATAIAGGADWMVAVAAAMSYADRAAPVLRRRRVVRASQPTPPQRERTEVNNGNVRQAPQETAFAGTPPIGYGLGPQHTQD